MKFLVLKVFFEGNTILPEYYDLSSSIRGIWGRNLKSIYCLQRNISCSDCGFSHCIYYNVFEKQSGNNNDYRPYIIWHNTENKDETEVHFVFFGIFSEYFDRLMAPILQIQDRPLLSGNKQIDLRINRILDFKNNLIFDSKSCNFSEIKTQDIEMSPVITEQLTLRFISPLRMKYQNVLMREFILEAFVKSIIKRYSAINEYFNNNESEALVLNESVLDTRYESNLKWTEKYRRSFRQNEKMSIGGLTGTVKIYNPSADLIKILQYGELIQAGKQTSFGNGKYVIEY